MQIVEGTAFTHADPHPVEVVVLDDGGRVDIGSLHRFEVEVTLGCAGREEGQVEGRAGIVW